MTDKGMKLSARNRLPGRVTGIKKVLLWLAMLLILSTDPVPLRLAAQAVTFADPAFQTAWDRTDRPVADGAIKRGYYWGPQPGAVKKEAYRQGTGGARLVQYFDKSRMEINDPGGNKSSPFYITNGLLTAELVTGRLQVGDNQYVDRYPAQIPLASDTDDPTAPTYATFGKLMAPAESGVGGAVVRSVDRAGNVTVLPAAATRQEQIAYYEPATGHNIPQVFWDYLNSSGPVIVDGKQASARLSDPWFYAAGLPITEPYWSKVKIAGTMGVDVYIQPYQRRVLTYVPSLPEGFQVQMGNIGQHYYDWRYNFAGKPAPTPTAVPKTTATPLPTLGPTGLTVFAAASLQDSFKEAGTNFKQANPNVTDLLFNFQGSQALVAQLQQGAPADVFASADKTNMDKAVAANLIEGAPKELLRNVLTVVLPEGNPANIQSLKDLAKPGVTISLADPSVPVGNYSLQVLDKLAADPSYGPAYKQQVLDNVVTHEDNVRAVLTRVQLDQVDAGIVYVTDALAANKAASGNIKPVKTLEIPVNFNVVATYYIAQLKDAAHPQAAQAFMNYILSVDGQALLTRYGFIPAGGQ